MKTLSFPKTSSFLSAFKFYILIMIIQLSKNIRFMGICVKTKILVQGAKQTAPLDILNTLWHERYFPLLKSALKISIRLWCLTFID